MTRRLRRRVVRRLDAARGTRASGEHGGEGGYVLVFMALSMTIILAFTAFTVDYGSWYNRAAQLKRAADAAALAGVVWMPEFDSAQSAALAAAARNGFVPSANISVDVDEVPGNNRQLQVTIRDKKAKQFFSRVVLQNQSIGRTSLAEYVMPVPLGSPKNTFGTGDLLNGTDKENFWAAVSGYCSGHESGDKKLSYYESYDNDNSSGCNNSSPQSLDDYDPQGYLYAIKLPQNASSLKLEVYDAPYYRSGSDSDKGLMSNQTITTTFEVYDRNLTPLDLSNLTLLQSYTFTTDQTPGTYQNQWTRLRTWTNPQAGEYYLRVKTSAETNNSRGSNGFAIRAFTGSSFATCTTISGQTGYSASCPQVYGVSDMSIFANADSTTAQFYLAQIDPVHQGKTMRINLFDAGEGADTLRIVDPNGAFASFTWSTACSPPPSGGCTGSGTSLDVSGTGTKLFSYLNSGSKFNDRTLILDIQLPPNYVATYGTKTWWKIEYAAGTDPTDRTTWSVNIVGDPVHLVS